MLVTNEAPNKWGPEFVKKKHDRVVIEDYVFWHNLYHLWNSSLSQPTHKQVYRGQGGGGKLDPFSLDQHLSWLMLLQKYDKQFLFWTQNFDRIYVCNPND